MGRIRVLMVSKACIRASYRKKLEELARFPGLEIRLVVPPGWQEGGKLVPLEPGPAPGYELMVEAMAFNGHFHLHFYPRLRRHFREFHPHILHMDEEPYNLATFQGFRLAEAVGAKCLFFTWQNLLKAYPWPFSALERYILKQASFALAGNHEAAETLRAKGYRGEVEVIPQFGVDPELFQSRADSCWRQEGKPFAIGYVGRLIEAKGVQVLLGACELLPDGNWRLEILGDGPYHPTLEQLATKLGLQDKVSFRSPIPSSELPAFLGGLDVLVLPSLTRPQWKEQFGRVLVEAMACGVSVIGSSSGEIPQVIGDAGLVFPEGDAQALAGELARLMEGEGLRKELARKGRERVLATYTQAQIARRTYEVYRKMLA